MILKPAVRLGNRFQNPVPTSVGSASTMFKVLALYFTNKAERTPKRKLGPFHTDPRVYETPPASGLRLTWMGHSSTLVEIDGVRVLLDPVWDQRASFVEWAGPKRFFYPPLELDQLPRIDAVLISHDHFDHLGANTIRRLARMESMSEVPWITTLGVGKILTQFGIRA